LGIVSEVVKIARECTYVQGIKKRREEEWSSKGMDRCPLTNKGICPLSQEKGNFCNDRV
jgi:hypothetical protein